MNRSPGHKRPNENDLWTNSSGCPIVMDQFSINYAMLIILGFYFGGGAVEGFMEKKKK